VGRFTVPNQVTNAGLAEVCGLIASDITATAFDYLAIGIGTTAITAGDTTLGSEITGGGGARAAATSTVDTSTPTQPYAQFVNTFSFTGTYAVTEAGVFNASSGGDMLAAQTFSAVNVSSGDSLNITYKITAQTS